LRTLRGESGHFGRLTTQQSYAAKAGFMPMGRVVDVNFRGTPIAVQAVLKHLKNGAHIIMIWAVATQRVMMPALAACSSAKGAIRMFKQTLFRKGAGAATADNIQPGLNNMDLNLASGERVAQNAATSFDHCKRLEDVAALVEFVASPDVLVNYRSKYYCRWVNARAIHGDLPGGAADDGRYAGRKSRGGRTT
jgi:NAD(P)-dependent dehydrogenase (short-subunit alcohol dehydrogenase family)